MKEAQFVPGIGNEEKALKSFTALEKSWKAIEMLAHRGMNSSAPKIVAEIRRLLDFIEMEDRSMDDLALTNPMYAGGLNKKIDALISLAKKDSEE